jgi:hypothetical protein
VLVPLTGITGFYIGTRYYWPDGYVEVARPQCTGVTPEGCALRWQDVPTDDGGTIAQCVQLCPKAEAPPVPVCPATCAPALPEPAAATGGCLLDIFAEPNFAGNNDETDEDQPELGDWENGIGSIEVKSGNWNFFTEPDFKGEVMRLAPGKYGTLNEPFAKTIGSFQCIDR